MADDWRARACRDRELLRVLLKPRGLELRSRSIPASRPRSEGGVPLAELPDGRCRFFLDRDCAPRDGRSHCCGARVAGGRGFLRGSYCREHLAALVVAPLPARCRGVDGQEATHARLEADSTAGEDRATGEAA